MCLEDSFLGFNAGYTHTHARLDKHRGLNGLAEAYIIMVDDTECLCSTG